MASVYVSNGDFVAREESMKPAGFMYRKRLSTVSRTESEVNDFVNLLHGSDPLRVELNRLDNEVRDKDRELGDAHTEIKALKYTDRLKERALEELTDELNKVYEKLKATEDLVENKNLEIKKINEEKKSALAAQFAAEATLRRVHAAQKDDEMPPIEAIIAPLEAELKLARSEVAKLQDDNRALDRLTKSKEAALVEAQRTVEIALIKASLVDDLQNKNQELLKQIEICQEENRILDKMQRQKVSEVEKLTQTVHELEEAVLSGGAAANAVRDYQRKVQEMNEEMRTLDRELARAKISANRVAVVVANDWKEGNDKVMPVRQWLEERRFFQGEMQQLKDKLVVAERAAKSEAELKEKYQLRFKVLEERLKPYPNGTTSRRQSLGGSEILAKSSHCGQVRPSSAVALLRRAKNSSRSLDDDVSKKSEKESGEIGKIMDKNGVDNGDFVCGVLYDMLQKEVIGLRKACHEKDQNLKDKDDAIEMLGKKVETLNKAMEVESKKMRREIGLMEKELNSMRNNQNGPRTLLPRNGSHRHY